MGFDIRVASLVIGVNEHGIDTNSPELQARRIAAATKNLGCVFTGVAARAASSPKRPAPRSIPPGG
jgi:hypothetical protein